MKEVLIKDVMIPFSNYVRVKKDDTLIEVMEALETSRKSDAAHAHRDALVVDENGHFLGKLTMIDAFMALEPTYQRIMAEKSKGMLTKDYVMHIVRDFKLWAEPFKDLCEKCADMKVSGVMHVPSSREYINEEDSIDKALHEYIIGVHQPLIVKRGNTVSGVLRLGDLFEIVRKRLLACKIG